jgi:hypothetical protein
MSSNEGTVGGTSFHELDFDGLTDLVGYHPDGELAASRYACVLAGMTSKTFNR